MLHLQLCNTLEKGKPRKAQRVFLRMKAAAQGAITQYNHCSVQEFPWSPRVNTEGVESKHNLEHCPQGNASFPRPCSGHPSHWQLLPLCITHRAIPSPPVSSHLSCFSTRGSRHGKDLSSLCAESEELLDLKSRMFSSPQKTSVAFLSTLFCAPTGLIRS